MIERFLVAALRITPSPNRLLALLASTRSPKVVMDSIQDCKHACAAFSTQVLMPLLFYSQPVAADATSFPQWDLLINDTAPVWAYVSYSLDL